MKFKIFVVVLCLQISIIIVLFIQIKQKNSKILGVSVNPIKSDTIQKMPSGKLKYFYELKSNTIDSPNKWGPNIAINTINSDALNERFDYSVKKDSSVFRIITLGDSFTYGLYVNTKDNWTERLEDFLNEKNTCTNISKFEVINLAVQGYDITYNVERYRIRGIKYNPDLVLWFLTDPNRITEMINAKITENREKWIKEGLNENSYEFWSKAFNEVMKEFTPDTIRAYQLKMLNKMNDLYKGNLVFFYQKDNSANWGQKQFPYIDTFANMRKDTFVHPIVNVVNTAKYHFTTDYHPNITGHKAIAEDIFQYLTKNKLILCSP